MVSETSYLPNRFERKYVISEAHAAVIRMLVRSHARPDLHLRPDQPNGYPVFSLYLDSPQLDLYRATAQGMKNRFKLRVRYYNDQPDSPIFLEIKRRLDQVVRKQRAAIRREALDELLRGGQPTRAAMIDSRQDFAAMEEFCRLRRALNAIPTLTVGYHREAYLDTLTGRCRVTFDRNLRAKAYNEFEGLAVNLAPVQHQDPGVILEMKYVDRLPAWMQRIIHMFGLERQSVPKYGWSVEELSEVVVVSQATKQFLGRVIA